MIGDISLGASFFHCISYCLEDKTTLTEEQKIKKSLQDGLQHKDRAEVLAYNKCFGNKYELAEQFNEVARLSKRVEKPVLHLSLSLPPGEQLDRNQLIEAGQELAKEFGVADNQYLIIQHKDTDRQHIHLVANRVGYQGKAATTSNNYLKMDRLCRRLEKKYRLQEVLSARRFLSKEQRLIPRQDRRKEKMKYDIRQTLKKAKNYDEFAKGMQQLGYQIIKGRGITFIDDKKVKVKGSELGYSLMTIQKLLQRSQTQELKQKDVAKDRKLKIEKQSPNQQIIAANARLRRKIKETQHPPFREQSPLDELQKGIGGIISDLLKPVYPEDNAVNYELLKEAHKRKKRRKPKV
ncbi:MAG: relaxase/mobilization nuclease domain-containing protein [Chitinophagaceae bacterium]|nr:relaxase/mobilization nuclease domain-containing protein [Chitinophagaceae bacterium]MCW5927020.1 relaxase/mobilization nuclease domain-containing protein [Chitinophagaceae bacterium]